MSDTSSSTPNTAQPATGGPGDIDPDTAAQLDAADTHQDPHVDDGPPAAEPDEMSRVIEKHADDNTDPQTGQPTSPESLNSGSEW